MIHIDKLYDLMATKGFQEPRTGNLFFPAYIYTYPPDHEYAIREQLAMLNEKLSRPSHYLDCMMVNIYHELLDYLQEVAFAGRTLFEGHGKKNRKTRRGDHMDTGGNQPGRLLPSL